VQRQARAVVSIAGKPGGFAELAAGSATAPASPRSSQPRLARDAATGRDPYQASKVVNVVRRDVPRGIPVLAKLAPVVHSVVDVTRAVVKAGADGVVLAHTVPGMAIDRRTLRPALGGVTGGLSGPAVHALAVRCVWEAPGLPDVCVVGVGGVPPGTTPSSCCSPAPAPSRSGP
jgi:dihydroorotate dehydrogenase (NAD+) catalytic subunit